LPGQFVAQAAPKVDEITLRQCYEWAKKRNENLKIHEEDIEQSQSRARAALSGAFPHLGWNFTNTRLQPGGVEALERKGFSGFVEKNQIESKFFFKQPLFSGLREFSAYSGFKKESARDTLLLERISEELFEKTAIAFYATLASETDMENTKTTLALAQDRVRELDTFLRLGKARKSEKFAAQARAAAIKATLRQVQARIVANREDLSYLTGENLSAATLVDEIPGPPSMGTLDEALAQAQSRKDLRAQREDTMAKDLRVRYENGFHWPTLDLAGNYYTHRATFLNEIKWDLGLFLEVPIFTGGSVSAKVQEAQSAYRQSLLTLQEMERGVLYSVRKTYEELTACIEETQSLEEAAQAAQKSYDALIEEYRLGLVTNLEVLEALDLLQSQKSAQDRSRLQAKLLFIQLGVATEKLR